MPVVGISPEVANRAASRARAWGIGIELTVQRWVRSEMVAPHRLPCETPEAYKPSDLAAHTTRWVLPATILGSSMSFIDGSVVNVALPVMQRSLTTSFGTLQWVVNGYMLTLASLILFGGSAGDRFGRRRVFVIGLGTFALASLVCGLAPSASWLVAARLVQGVGAALLTPTSLAIVGSAFSGEARGVADRHVGRGGRAHDRARASARRLARRHDWLALDLLHQSADRRGSPAVRAQASSGSRHRPIGTAGSRRRRTRSPVARIAELRLDRARGRRAARRRRSLDLRGPGDLDLHSTRSTHAIADDAAVAVPRPQLQRGERPYGPALRRAERCVVSAAVHADRGSRLQRNRGWCRVPAIFGDRRFGVPLVGRSGQSVWRAPSARRRPDSHRSRLRDPGFIRRRPELLERRPSRTHRCQPSA